MLLIAHRLTTVMNADCILVLDGGRVAEQGTHRELLARGGLYRRMWEESNRKSTAAAAAAATAATAAAAQAVVAAAAAGGGR